MDPTKKLAADALFIVMGRIGADTPELSTTFMHGLQMHCQGDPTILQKVVEALVTTGYSPEDFDRLGGYANLLDAVNRARRHLLSDD